LIGLHKQITINIYSINWDGVSLSTSAPSATTSASFTFESAGDTTSRPKPLDPLSERLSSPCKMLSRSVQRLHVTAARAINTSAPTKVLQHVAQSTPTPHEAAGIPPLSSGELAWCEVYGVDYERQLQEALDDAPLLVSQSTPVDTPASAGAKDPKADIWSVVFGKHSA
jgi:hypothetical protein